MTLCAQFRILRPSPPDPHPTSSNALSLSLTLIGATLLATLGGCDQADVPPDREALFDGLVEATASVRAVAVDVRAGRATQEDFRRAVADLPEEDQAAVRAYLAATAFSTDPSDPEAYVREVNAVVAADAEKFGLGDTDIATSSICEWELAKAGIALSAAVGACGSGTVPVCVAATAHSFTMMAEHAQCVNDWYAENN